MRDDVRMTCLLASACTSDPQMTTDNHFWYWNAIRSTADSSPRRLQYTLRPGDLNLIGMPAVIFPKCQSLVTRDEARRPRDRPNMSSSGTNLDLIVEHRHRMRHQPPRLQTPNSFVHDGSRLFHLKGQLPKEDALVSSPGIGKWGG